MWQPRGRLAALNSQWPPSKYISEERVGKFFFKFIYLSNTEPLTSLSCPLNAVFHVLRGPVPQDAGKPSHLLLQIVNLFFNAFILWNNSGVTNLQRLFHAVFHLLRGPRPQYAGTPLLLCVLTSEA
jgi:hypothetical protein